MILADILQWFLLILGALFTLVAHWLAAHALFPRAVSRARAQYERAPAKATLVGLAIAVPTLFVAIAAANALPHPVVKALAVGLGLLIGLFALVGSAGLVERIGVGLPSSVDSDAPWRRMLRGGVVLSLTFLMPFLGWFVLLPWTLVSGLGAWALAGRAPSVAAVSSPGAVEQAS